ncbi:hypothetical protein OnM2_052035, partial [Erysiphe neolycopersici]
MKRMMGIGSGRVFLRRIWCMVGTAVYQLALKASKSIQNSEAENLGGMIIDPPDPIGARKPARRPWTWNSGMTLLKIG